MMVPVVFLILPTTVVFALYPGLVSIATLTALARRGGLPCRESAGCALARTAVTCRAG